MGNKISIVSQNFLKTLIIDNKSFILEVLNTEQTESERLFKSGAIYFYLMEGKAKLSTDFYSTEVKPGMYFSQNAPLKILLRPKSKALIIVVDYYCCLNMLGGPIEAKGRLDYINGCSDTLLIAPSRLGEPCLNLLHFPIDTIQTQHHHPSFRFGLVASGQGECVSKEGSIQLNAGDTFFISAFVQHKFNTYAHPMNIIAFHPDSDWGPTDEIHPMKNRTIIS